MSVNISNTIHTFQKTSSLKEYSDNFDSYADYSHLGGQGNWVNCRSGVQLAVYKPASDGEIYPHAYTENAVYYNAPVSNDQYSQITFTSVPGKSCWIGVAVRVSASGYYMWYCNGPSIQVAYVDGSGGYNQLNSGGTAWQAGDVIKLVIVGSELRFYINGVLDTAIDSGDGKITHTTLTTGYPGLSGWGSNNEADDRGVRADDWQGGDVYETPSILSSSSTVAWYSAEAANVTKDGSNFVSAWNDLSSTNHDLAQATGSYQPLWSADGVTFDGSDNFMNTTFTLTTPVTMYVVCRYLTLNTWRRWWDGHTAAFFMTTTNQNDFTFISANAQDYYGDEQVTTAAFHIIRAIYNDTSSYYKYDAHVNGPGAAGTCSNTGGITLGSEGGGTGSWTNICFKEVIIRDKVDSSDDETAIYNYLKAKYAL